MYEPESDREVGDSELTSKYRSPQSRRACCEIPGDIRVSVGIAEGRDDCVVCQFLLSGVTE